MVFTLSALCLSCVEQRFDKKLVTDANNHLDPLECVDIKCRRYVRPDSRVTDQTDIPYITGCFESPVFCTAVPHHFDIPLPSYCQTDYESVPIGGVHEINFVTSK